VAEDPEARWQSANEVKAELELAGRAESKRPAGKPLWAFAAAAVIVGAGVLFFALQRSWRVPADSPVVRLAIPLPEEGVNAEPPGMVGPPAISPDGKAVVVALGPANNRVIWIRRFDTGRFERLPGVDKGDTPFWSPDSRHVGFFTAGGKLQRVPVAGGSLQTICSSPPIASIRGAAWSSSGDIIYGVNWDGLYRVPDRGGNPARIAAIDPALAESSLRNPAFLADGLHFVCFSRTDRLEQRGLYLYTRDGSAPRKKLAVTDQHVAVGRDSGTGREYALYSKDARLWAQAIEPSRGELTGEPIQIDEDVGLFSVSNTGTLVYRRTNVEQGQYTWYDRTGRELGAVGAPVDSWDVELSPDDRYVAFQNHRSLDGHFSIWLIDTTRNVSSPFSLQTERSYSPVWSGDSARVYFTSSRSNVFNSRRAAFVKAVDDATPERPLNVSGATFLDDLTLDGKYLVGTLFLANQTQSLVYSEFGREIWQPLAKADGSQQRPHFSPDGHWVAYDSDESGATEVYVVDFPAARRKQRISTAGGKEARWTRDGREIVFYASEGALMSASFTGGAAGLPKRLFPIRFSTGIDGFHYALSRDGQRILAMKEVGVERSRNLNVVMNGPALLRRE
jgi:Tol biopolymer transport system component